MSFDEVGEAASRYETYRASLMPQHPLPRWSALPAEIRADWIANKEMGTRALHDRILQGVCPECETRAGQHATTCTKYAPPPPPPPADPIRPAHYDPNGLYEALKVMRAWHGDEAVIHFCVLTAEKYLARAGKKSGEPDARDWRKAAFYLNHAADLREGK